MPFFIRDPETEALVRKLAQKEKVGLTEAVKIATRDRLETLRAKASLHERLTAIADDIGRFPATGKKVGKSFFDALSHT